MKKQLLHEPRGVSVWQEEFSQQQVSNQVEKVELIMKR